MKTHNIILLSFVISFVLGTVAKYIFGNGGILFVTGLYVGFFGGIMIKNYLFERNPDDDILYVIEKNPELADRITSKINSLQDTKNTLV